MIVDCGFLLKKTAKKPLKKQAHSHTCDVLGLSASFDRSLVCLFQSSTQEFFLICSSLSRLALELQALLPVIQSQISSALLRNLLLDTPDMLAPAHGFLKVLSEKAAK